MSKTIDVSKAEFESEVLKSDKPVLVDFWAPWCMPCKMMGPVLEELAEDMKESLKVVKVNTEEAENQELAAKYEIQTIPNLKLFKAGEIIGEFVGLKNKESLKEDIEKLLAL